MSVFGGGSGGIGTGIVYSLVDQFSGPADKITAKFQKMEGVTEKSMDSINKSMGKIKTGVAALALAGAVFLPLGKAIDEAAEYEKHFQGIKHTVKLTGQGYDELSNKLRAVSKTGTSALDDLIVGAEMAGKMGVQGIDKVVSFSKNVVRFAGDANMSVEESATMFKRLSQILDIPLDKIENIGSAALELGDTFSANTNDIMGFSAKIAGAGKIAGLSTADILGMSTAFVSVGADAGRGGNAVAKTLYKMNDAVNISGDKLTDFAKVAGVSVGEFSDVFRKEPVKAFDMFIQGLGRSGNQATALMDDLELSDIRLMNMMISVSDSSGNMGKAISLATKSYEEGTTMAEHAAMKYNTVAGQTKIMENNMKDLSLTIGNMFLPVMMVINKVISGTVRLFNWLAGSTVGKFIIGLIAVVGVLAGLFGIFTIAVNIGTFAMAKFQLALIEAGFAEVATAFATGGLTAGMWALATAVWTALAPFLPFLAAIAAVIGIIWGANKAIDAYADVLNGKAVVATEGWSRVLQQIGGVLTGIGEVFRTAGDDGFTMSKKMRDSLEQLGVLDFVVAIGTWAVRIKTFFKGMKEGFMEAWGVIKQVWSYMKKPFEMLGNFLGKLGLDFWKGAGAMEEWAKWGKRIAYVIVGFITLALSPLIIAIGSAIAIFMLIGAVISAIIYPFTHWGETVEWVKKQFNSLISTVGDFFSGIGQWFAGIFKSAMTWGADIVNGIWKGIKSAWTALQDWFTNALNALIAPFTSILSMLGIIDDVKVSTNTTSTNINTPTKAGVATAQGKNNSVAGNTETYTYNHDRTVVRDINVVMPDGKVLARVVNSENDQTKTRRTG